MSLALCQDCCLRNKEIQLLTGYCITACRCDECGKKADLAIVEPVKAEKERA